MVEGGGARGGGGGGLLRGLGRRGAGALGGSQLQLLVSCADDLKYGSGCGRLIWAHSDG